MSGAQKLMRDVMRAHTASSRRVNHPWRKGFLINVAACAGEGCGWVSADEDTDHAEHVAAEVDKALGGLTLESGLSYTPPNDPDNPRIITDRIDARAVRAFRGMSTEVSRWVSGWTEVPR